MVHTVTRFFHSTSFFRNFIWCHSCYRMSLYRDPPVKYSILKLIVLKWGNGPRLSQNVVFDVFECGVLKYKVLIKYVKIPNISTKIYNHGNCQRTTVFCLHKVFASSLIHRLSCYNMCPKWISKTYLKIGAFQILLLQCMHLRGQLRPSYVKCNEEYSTRDVKRYTSSDFWNKS